MARGPSWLERWFPVVATTVAAAVAALWLLFAPLRLGQPVAAVFPAGWSVGQAYAAAADAGVSVMQAGRFENVLILRADGDGFRRRLQDRGAWLLIGPGAMLFCGPAAVHLQVDPSQA